MRPCLDKQLAGLCALNKTTCRDRLRCLHSCTPQHQANSTTPLPSWPQGRGSVTQRAGSAPGTSTGANTKGMAAEAATASGKGPLSISRYVPSAATTPTAKSCAAAATETSYMHPTTKVASYDVSEGKLLIPKPSDQLPNPVPNPGSALPSCSTRTPR